MINYASYAVETGSTKVFPATSADCWCGRLMQFNRGPSTHVIALRQESKDRDVGPERWQMAQTVKGCGENRRPEFRCPVPYKKLGAASICNSSAG